MNSDTKPVCGWDGCTLCNPTKKPKTNTTTNDISTADKGETVVTTITADAVVKTTKVFTVTLDEVTASKLFDVLYRHVGGHQIGKLVNELRGAGVDTAPRYKSINEKVPPGAYSRGYVYQTTQLAPVATPAVAVDF